jgi:3-(3-hydroxy-phenyl)propionate hydroxylase
VSEAFPQTCDVGIVGYGPVGAFTALLLAESGLRVAILERSTDAVELPRAVGLDGESMRAFQRIGLGETVAAILQPKRPGERIGFTDSKRNLLFGMEVPGRGPMGWRDMSFFDQPELEALLRELVAKQERIEVGLGCTVTALSQTAEDVTVSYGAPDGSTRSLRSAFLLGCDGASSTVRDLVGIDWQSLGYDQDWLVVDIVADPDCGLPLDTLQVCDPARLTSYICVKDPNRRWEFQLQPGETREEMLRPERIEALLDPWLPRGRYAIRRAAVYQFHAATAGHWREGRVLLAGDAAHQTPPFLGQGLNSGFRDAVNLGWKLPLVLAGTCDARLLDSYADERDAHARDLVERAVSIGKLMETLAAREAGLPDPHPDGPGDGSPNIPPLRGGALVREQVAPGAPVGRLLVQPTVRRDGEGVCRFDELLGRGFAVVARRDADARMGPEAREILDRLGARVVTLEGLEGIEGDVDRLFLDHPAALVRPDRTVFGVVDAAWSLDRLVAELGRRLHLVHELP